MKQSIELSIADLSRIETLIEYHAAESAAYAEDCPGKKAKNYWAAERDADDALLKRYRAARDKADA